jgi:uncharacterized protein YndB with AHSA1/START domain
MKHYETTTSIAAPPEAVWAVLTDAAARPSWDSGVTAVEGRIAEGEKITVRNEVSPGRAFPVKVTALDAPRRMVLSGGMPLGLFRGERTYTLTPADGGSSSFRMREEYTGPLLGMIWKSMPDLQPSFDRFAAGLKKRVESGA